MPIFEPRSIREDRQTIAQAKNLRLMCPHCHGCVYVTLIHPYTAANRHRVISEAIGEHRRLCTAAPPEASRVYRLDYPRA